MGRVRAIVCDHHRHVQFAPFFFRDASTIVGSEKGNLCAGHFERVVLCEAHPES